MTSSSHRPPREKRSGTPVDSRPKTSAPRRKWFAIAGLCGGLAIVVLLLAWLVVRSGPGADQQAALSTLKTEDFHVLVVSPESPSRVLFGHHGGILASPDGGETWKGTSLQRSGDDAMGMAFDPSNPQAVYAAGHNTLFASGDGGQTWAAVSSDLPSKDIHALTMVARDRPTLVANVVGLGLMQSVTDGRQWTGLAATGLPRDVRQLTASGSVLYAASPGAVFRSGDGGQSFTRLGRLDAFVFSLAAAQSEPNRLYAGTNAGLAVSADAGATWTMSPLPRGSEVLAVAVAPQDSRRVVVVSVDSEGVGHVFSSGDAGSTWTTE